EHEVIFAGNNEIVTLSHSATSREIFANGALKAAEFIVGKAPALYNMSDVINQI
ncbi:MAG: 4-hydroxy-tetrahydrodipicolinate reductase, partial [Clostridia bacterium]|nr:4-hydroxy-tetrahydrodipicolinate reductase [Clostridia bacterium]